MFWNQWAYLGRVCFLTFCDLKLFLVFEFSGDIFLVTFFSFENFESYFGIKMCIFGEVSFLTFCDLRVILDFLDFKGSFFSLISEF